MTTFDYPKISKEFLRPLSSRQREVLERRFGLKNGQKETLEKIGRDHNLTRERVRQIQNDALAKAREEAKREAQVFSFLERKLMNWGGLKREDKLVEELGGQRFENHLLFLLHLGEPFSRKKEDREFYSLWLVREDALILAKKTVDSLEKLLNQERQVLPFDTLFQRAREAVSFSLTLDKKSFESFVEATKKIEQGPTGHFGLSHWPEITPRGVKDRAYLVFQQAGKPLHFQEVAQLINQHFQNSSRKALPQTVHNELIKDPRFVLVGRGLYALKEWGFEEGTVKEVIYNTLKKAKRPLSKEEILAKVQEQRLVQPNTILLGLGDKNYFKKNSQGKYTLR